MNSRLSLFLLSVTSLLISYGCNNQPPKKQPRLSKTLFEGQWVRADYALDIAKTRSPFGSREKLNGLATVIIDTGRLKGDSLVADASWNNHEGYALTVYFDETREANSVATSMSDPNNPEGCYSLGCRINGADTTLVLYHISDHTLKDSLTYIRAKRGKATDAAAPIQYIVNKTLFAGAYQLYDSAGNKGSVVMDNNGTTKGIAGYTAYYAGTDFNGGDTADYLALSAGTDESDKVNRGFSFSAGKDTLKLYGMKQSRPDEWVTGGLVYTLVRDK